VCAAEPQADGNPEDREARLAQLESRARKGKKGPQPISQSQNPASSGGKMVEWKEGQLFPEGWDAMDPIEKAGQLYMGERGVLFWLNKSATASVVIIAGAWILFRFVGPAIGLYELSMGPVQM
jgi:hypothetical protein